MKTLVTFLRKNVFVVLTANSAGCEAWAYEGPLDFMEATPRRFGLGKTPAAALKALDHQLAAVPASAAILPPACHPSRGIVVDRRELATILAALRYHQAENLQGDGGIADLAIGDIATDGATLQPLNSAQIDALCQKLNSRQDNPGPLGGLQVDPPPVQEGDEPLWRVVYLIDISAANSQDAAQQAAGILSDPDSLPPILHVIASSGHSVTIDLASA